MATKTIKLVKAWGLHPQDATISPDTPVADLLIQSGRAVAVEVLAEMSIEKKAKSRRMPFTDEFKQEARESLNKALTGS